MAISVLGSTLPVEEGLEGLWPDGRRPAVLPRIVPISLALLLAGSPAAWGQMAPPPRNPAHLPNRDPVQANVPTAREIRGRIHMVEHAMKRLTLDDGTMLRIPPSVKVTMDALQKWTQLGPTYKEQGGQKVVTSLQGEPRSKS